MLCAVDLVVGLFVGLQLAYLFGGLDTLAAAGMTYSDYARRGYFELVAAAVPGRRRARRRSRSASSSGRGCTSRSRSGLSGRPW